MTEVNLPMLRQKRAFMAPTGLPVLALAAVLLLAAARAAHAKGQDTVLLDTGRTVPGVTVLREGYDKVEVDRDGDGKADESFPGEGVVNVTYDDAPMSFRQGSVFIKQERFKEAADYFAKAVEEKDVRAFWLKQHANYLLGECRRRMGETEKDQLAEARRAYERVGKEVPDGRLVPYAIRGLGLCYMEEGKNEAARGEFAKLVEKGHFGAPWALQGKLLLAQLSSREGKHAEALALCDEVLRAAEADTAAKKRSDLLGEARLRRAEVLIAAGQHAKAREMFMQIAAETDERNVKIKARAYNAIGDCFLGENRTREALLAYLRVRVLYFEAKDELPRALYGAARCFTALKEPERARELVTLLQKEYPNSLWTVKAQKELGG